MKIKIESNGKVPGTSIRNMETGERVGYVQRIEIIADVKLGFQCKLVILDPKTMLTEDTYVEFGELKIEDLPVTTEKPS